MERKSKTGLPDCFAFSRISICAPWPARKSAVFSMARKSLTVGGRFVNGGSISSAPPVYTSSSSASDSLTSQVKTMIFIPASCNPLVFWAKSVALDLRTRFQVCIVEPDLRRALAALLRLLCRRVQLAVVLTSRGSELQFGDMGMEKVQSRAEIKIRNNSLKEAEIINGSFTS